MISVLFCTCFSDFAFSENQKSAVYKLTHEKKSGYVTADGYDYSNPVPKNAAVDMSYFNDVLILGDSRTVDLMIYTNISKTKILPYCDVGLNINTVYTKEFVNIGGKKYSAVAALKKNKDKFKKAYLMFGLNELGYTSVSAFCDNYAKLINTVRNANKDALIYVQAIIPVSKQKDLSSDTFNNRRIEKFNKAIKQMCEDEKVFYLDFCDNFKNCENYLADDAAYDGIHFKPDYCGGWLDLIRTHTVNTEKSVSSK